MDDVEVEAMNYFVHIVFMRSVIPRTTLCQWDDGELAEFGGVCLEVVAGRWRDAKNTKSRVRAETRLSEKGKMGTEWIGVRMKARQIESTQTTITTFFCSAPSVPAQCETYKNQSDCRRGGSCEWKECLFSGRCTD